MTTQIEFNSRAYWIIFYSFRWEMNKSLNNLSVLLRQANIPIPIHRQQWVHNVYLTILNPSSHTRVEARVMGRRSSMDLLPADWGPGSPPCGRRCRGWPCYRAAPRSGPAGSLKCLLKDQSFHSRDSFLMPNASRWIRFLRWISNLPEETKSGETRDVNYLLS